MFDGDQAGLLAVDRAAELNQTDHALRFLVASLPEGLDPAASLAGTRSHAFERALAEAVPLEHHLIDRIVRQHDLNEPEAIARAVQAVQSVVCGIVDPATRARAISRLAQIVGRDEALIRTYVEERTHRPARRRTRGLERGIA